MRPSADPRAAALRVIERVTEEGAYSSITLQAELDRSGLRPRDRALAAELAYGTLRRVLGLDWALAAHSTRPVERMTKAARAVLRLGAYQLLFTRIPDHAAVAETVRLAAGRERGFVNAVLRSALGPADKARALEAATRPMRARFVQRTGLGRIFSSPSATA